MKSKNGKHCWLLEHTTPRTFHVKSLTGREMNVSGVDYYYYFFFKKKVGGTRDLFLFKRFEKCSGIAVCVCKQVFPII